MNIYPKISLGTAQFGRNYGITNNIGKVRQNDIRKILDKAAKLGVKHLDTAPSYGEAEAILGKTLDKNDNFKLVSKFPKQSANKFEIYHLKKWEKEFEESLSNLRVNSLDTLLLHSSNDLKKQNSNILREWLLTLKQRNLVKKIGISIYNKSDLENLSLNDLDVVQLPFSIYNQTSLIDGTIEKLKLSNCLIQVRSIFLQGLLITKQNRWPTWIKKRYLDHHCILEKIALTNNLSLLDLALDFIKKQNFIDLIVIGICSISQLEELKNSCEKQINIQNLNYEKFHIDDQTFNDPRFWPK